MEKIIAIQKRMKGWRCQWRGLNPVVILQAHIMLDRVFCIEYSAGAAAAALLQKMAGDKKDPKSATNILDKTRAASQVGQ